MAKKKATQINVEGTDITILQLNDSDYISLTDVAKQSDDEPRFLIRNWLSTQNTIAYLGVWESIHNKDFNRAGFRTVKDNFFERPFSLTPKRWIEETNSVGIISKSGRHGGGTYAHKDIALNFCYWLSPMFQVYLIKEFQRLKTEEAERQSLEWDVKRILTKINYRVHTDAIKENLIPPRIEKTKLATYKYTNEADILNVAVFGMTAKEWKAKNPNTKKGDNQRNYATQLQLVVLANLEAVNAELIRIGLNQQERIDRLNKAAITHTKSLIASSTTSKLPDKHKGL